MKKLWAVFGQKDFLLFIFCGGIGTLTNFICSALASQFLDPTLAYVIGYALSLGVAYFLNAKLIFKAALSGIGYLKFVISYIPNFIILFSLVCLLIKGLGWNNLLVYALAAVFGLPITFILVKILAFKNKSKENYDQ